MSAPYLPVIVERIHDDTGPLVVLDGHIVDTGYAVRFTIDRRHALPVTWPVLNGESVRIDVPGSWVLSTSPPTAGE